MHPLYSQAGEGGYKGHERLREDSEMYIKVHFYDISLEDLLSTRDSRRVSRLLKSDYFYLDSESFIIFSSIIYSN